MNYTIRNIKPHEYKIVRDWGNIQMFDRGTHDYLAFDTVNKNSFWIGQLEGEPISSIGCADYDQNLTIIGLYIVKRQHRSKNYGLKLWNEALSKVKAKNIGLVCAPSSCPRYQASGFKSQNKIFLYTITGLNQEYNSPCLVRCQDIDFEKLAKYDRINFPAQRVEFLRKWIDLPESKAVAFVRNNQIEGYGVLRISDQGYRIGPLFANSIQVAQQILKSLAGSVPSNKSIRIDIPDYNVDAVELATKFKMQKVYQLFQMYTNGQPPINNFRTIYAITQIQLG